METRTPNSAVGYEIHNTTGAVLLDRSDPNDVCFTGPQNLGARHKAKRFETADSATAFIRQHKLRSVCFLSRVGRDAQE